MLLPTGAIACVELKRFEEAITWCDKGLAVSFEGTFTVGIMEIVSIIWHFKGENTKVKRVLIMMRTCQLIYFKCAWLKNVGKVITSWLINDITPFSQFDLVILSMP